MALSANLFLQLANTLPKMIETYVISTNAVIYQHALLGQRATTGRVNPIVNATTQRFVGLAVECSTRSFPITGNGTTTTVDVIQNVDVLLDCTGVTQGSVNDAAYAADDEKGFRLTTLGPQIGRFTKFVSASPNRAWVRLGAAILADAT